MKRRETFLLVFFFALCLAGCGKKENIKLEVSEIILINGKKDLTDDALSYADSVLSLLTLEEIAGQCLMPSLNSTDDDYTLKRLRTWIKDFHIGGVVLLGGDTLSASRIALIGAEERVPLFVAIDAEWGLGMRLKDAPVFPKNGALGKEADEKFLYDYGYEIARESRNLGINMVLGPVIDVSQTATSVIGRRSFGRDPQRVAELGIAYAKGVEAGGVLSVAKHFPGHGMALHDSHKGMAVLSADISRLDSVDLKPFREYINSGLGGIMAGHIQATALDPDGIAASVSADMLTSLLREEMEFKGLVLTDAFDMGGARGFTATDAIKAGADIILCPLDVGKEYEDILRNVNDGNLELSVLKDRCRRILFMKYLFLPRLSGERWQQGQSFPESL